MTTKQSAIVPKRPQSVSDYILKTLAGAGAGAALGGGISKGLGGDFVSPTGLAAGGLLGGLGGFLTANWQNAHANRYKDKDWHGDKVYQSELPLVAGLIPGMRHSATFATLTPESYKVLSNKDKKKWRKWSKEKEDPIFFRVTSGSIDPLEPIIGDSTASDYAIARYLFEHGEPDNLHYDALNNRPLIEYFNGTRPADFRQVPAQFTNIAEIKLRDNKRKAIGKFINDAMDENVKRIENNQRKYNLFTNNCHRNTVMSNAMNTHFMPGTYSSGGLRGAEMTTGGTPEMYLWKDFTVNQS